MTESDMSAGPEFDASVIVSTRNRSVKLRHTLAALERQGSRRRWQLVVVDNGSTDDTAAVIAAFCAQTPLAAVAAVERRPGVAHAKNTALSHAVGRNLLFLDDDCYAAPDFVDAWIEVFETTDLDYAAGRIELYTEADAPFTIRTDTAPHRLSPAALLPQGYLQGANMACRRTVVDAVGLFDPMFGPGAAYLSADDMEYFQRAANLGFKGGYEPGPIVYHYHGRSMQDGPALMRDYDISYGAVLLKAALTNPHAVARRFAGRDGFASWPKLLYWDTRCRGLRRSVPYWLTRWRNIIQGGLHFAWNASLGRHAGYW